MCYEERFDLHWLKRVKDLHEKDRNILSHSICFQSESFMDVITLVTMGLIQIFQTNEAYPYFCLFQRCSRCRGNVVNAKDINKKYFIHSELSQPHMTIVNLFGVCSTVGKLDVCAMNLPVKLPLPSTMTI